MNNAPTSDDPPQQSGSVKQSNRPLFDILRQLTTGECWALGVGLVAIVSSAFFIGRWEKGIESHLVATGNSAAPNVWPLAQSTLNGTGKKAEWIKINGLQFCVVPIAQDGTARLSMEFDREPFNVTREVVSWLVNVERPEDRANVQWMVKSADAQEDPSRQESPAFVVHGHPHTVSRAKPKDSAYFLEARWLNEETKSEWCRRNTNAAVLMILR